MTSEISTSLPVGVLVRRRPGVTRWAKWAWKPFAVLPGAGPADWVELRREGETVEFHAGTVPMILHRADAEAYKVALSMRPPRVYVVLRPDPHGGVERPWRVHAVTASAYEAQDYQDSGDELVEPVAMPDALAAFVTAFADRHFREEPFVKRRRDVKRVDGAEDAPGDRRIRQVSDVFRAPGRIKPGATGP